MKNVLLACVALLFLAGCSTIRTEYNELHEDVFGCPPVGQEPSGRKLDAEGPRDEVERDFLGNECGKPVYTPECAPLIK